MKLLLLIMMVSLVSPVLQAKDLEPFLVRASVVELQMIPPRPPPPEIVNPPQQYPVWKAVLTIDAVFFGPQTLKDEKLFITTSDHVLFGSPNAILPRANPVIQIVI